MDNILSWGRPPKLVFESEEEFFRALGQITNEKAFTISYEPNHKTGSYAPAYRIRVLTGTKNIATALQKKMTTGSRINCNEYVLYLIEKHSFVQSGSVIMRSFETVLETVPEKYRLIFIQGYNEVIDTTLKQVVYTTDSIDVSKVVLTQKKIPKSGNKKKSTSKKQGKRDYIKQTINNYEIGEAGERIVYEYELKKLTEALKKGKIKDLKDKIEWVSRTDDSLGYDIRSYDVDKGTDIFIEVKTTTGSGTTPFYMSENELKKSSELKEQYLLYRLYKMDRHKPLNVDFFVLNGDLRMNENVSVEKQEGYYVQLIKEKD